ncbi:hypothetical protein NDU88_005193 [Pleurodeles waltl]|uniref:Uncharacterized protein n=1 Tax=Pleurodeles waltl TaxID=8319 RepID=A0AAV7WB66_PLEWA|nr:hypothetical protein NDU88_005193 [Pleurodeles waltl]
MERASDSEEESKHENGTAPVARMAAARKSTAENTMDLAGDKEVRRAGLALTVHDKKEDGREKWKPMVERNIENWLLAFRTLACAFVEKFPQSAAALFLHEQKVHEAQYKYQEDVWLHYDEDFLEKMQT